MQFDYNGSLPDRLRAKLLRCNSANVSIALENVPLKWLWELGLSPQTEISARFFDEGSWYLPEGWNQQTVKPLPHVELTAERVYADTLGIIQTAIQQLTEAGVPAADLWPLVPLGAVADVLWTVSYYELKERWNALPPPLRRELYGCIRTVNKDFSP